MALINLAPYQPSPGTTSDANAISNAFVAIQGAVNSIENVNISNTAAIAVSKLNLPGGTTNFLRADGSWAVPGVSSTLYRKTTTKDVVNTTTKTDLLNGEISVGANVLATTGAIHMWLIGDYLNNSASGKTVVLELKLGSQVVYDSSTSASFPNGAVRRAWNFHGLIQALGATNSQASGGLICFSDNNAPTTGLGPLNAPGTSPNATPITGAATTVDMTTSQTLTFSVTHSAAAATISMRLLNAMIMVIN